jgi:hypothetical protein
MDPPAVTAREAITATEMILKKSSFGTLIAWLNTWNALQASSNIYYLYIFWAWLTPRLNMGT